MEAATELAKKKLPGEARCESCHTVLKSRDVNLSDFFIKSNIKGARANLKTTF